LKTIRRATILWIFMAGLSAAPLMCEQPSPPASSPAAAIEVEMIQAGEISLPAEFQVAPYENLVQELHKKAASPRSIVTVTGMPLMLRAS
jgi:hypothetical protein